MAKQTLGEQIKQRAKDIALGFAQAANDSGLTNKSNRAPDAKSLRAQKKSNPKPKRQRPVKEKKVKQGPWMSSRDLRVYRMFVSPTKPTRVKVEGKWEVQEPEESIARHELFWAGDDDLHLRVVMARGNKQRKFQLQRFPVTDEDLNHLAQWISNLLYDKKSWRDYVLTIQDAISDLHQGTKIIIPVDDAAYAEDVDQDMD